MGKYTEWEATKAGIMQQLEDAVVEEVKRRCGEPEDATPDKTETDPVHVTVALFDWIEEEDLQAAKDSAMGRVADMYPGWEED